jgi:hypothetical protein
MRAPLLEILREIPDHRRVEGRLGHLASGPIGPAGARLG